MYRPQSHRRFHSIRIVASLVLVVTAVAPAARAGVSDYTVSEMSLGRIPVGPTAQGNTWATLVAPDGRHIAYLESAPGKGVSKLLFGESSSSGYLVRRDGTPGQVWDGISKASLKWSADSRHLMYVARKGDAVHLVVDDIAGPSFDQIQQFNFTQRGGHVVYRARRGDSEIVVIDGAQHPACVHDDASSDSLRLWYWISHGGERLACAAMAGGKWRLTVDGAPAAQWDDIEHFGFAPPDGRHYFYIARDGSQDRLVHDGTPGKAYDEAEALDCRDTPGTCVAWVKVAGRWYLARGDSVVGPGYDERTRRVLLVSRERRVAHLTGQGEKPKWTIHAGGSDHGPYDQLARHFWADGGTRWGTFAKRGKQWLLLVDGRETALPAKAEPHGPFFSPDERRVGYFLEERGDWTLVLDGQPAYSCDDVLGPRLAFSKDGRHWALVGKIEGKWSLVIDGEPAAERYSGVHWPGPAFDEDGAVSFLITDGEELRCVTYTPVAEP